MDNLNDIIRNYKYAPGIATYGPKGHVGIDGIDGKSCFFCTYNISISEELAIVNRKLRNNELLSEYKDVVLNREYQEGDIVIDNTGCIYKVSVIDTSTNDLGIDPIKDKVGEFSKDSDSNYFKLSSNGRLYNQQGNGIDFIKTSGENPVSVLSSDSNFVQRIYSDISDTESNYNLNSYIVQTNDTRKSLNTFFNKNDQCFHIEADAPIVIDCPTLAVEDNSMEYEGIDGYSQITSGSTNISKLYNLYKSCKYSFSSDYNLLYIEVPEEIKALFENPKFKPAEVILTVKEDDSFVPVKKYLLEVPTEITEYPVRFDISKLTYGQRKNIKVSLIKYIEVHLQEYMQED